MHLFTSFLKRSSLSSLRQNGGGRCFSVLPLDSFNATNLGGEISKEVLSRSDGQGDCCKQVQEMPRAAQSWGFIVLGFLAGALLNFRSFGD